MRLIRPFKNCLKDYFPTEILTYIYEFDPTYHHLFSIVIEQLIKPKVYHVLTNGNKIIYYIYFPKQRVLHMTNSITSPFYICTSYDISFFKMNDIIKQYKLFRKENLEEYFFLKNFIFFDLITNY